MPRRTYSLRCSSAAAASLPSKWKRRIDPGLLWNRIVVSIANYCHSKYTHWDNLCQESRGDSRVLIIPRPHAESIVCRTKEVQTVSHNWRMRSGCIYPRTPGSVCNKTLQLRKYRFGMWNYTFLRRTNDVPLCCSDSGFAVQVVFPLVTITPLISQGTFYQLKCSPCL